MERLGHRLPAALLLVVLLGTPAPAQEAQGERPSVGLKQIAEGLTSPVALVAAPDDSGRLFVVDQIGVIRVLSDGTMLEQPFLDISERLVELTPGFDERGLLGLAFHPNFATNGRFFVYYSGPLREGAPAGFNHTSRVSEFSVSATDPNEALHDSESILLQVDQPQFNHNAGTLLFGPDDGFLYISIGDGGGADDVGLGHVEDWYDANAGGNGQDIKQNLLGNILRIDVDGGDPYAIPADNPFVGTEGLDEIYAYGFRNPYRMSFDMGGNHELFVGDAGQNLWEEVSIAVKGGNFGWNVKEGTHCFDTENPDVSPSECPDAEPDRKPLIDPVIEYANHHQPGGLGAAVVGGHVYRGSSLPQFSGRYIFGDWSREFEEPDGSLFVAKRRKRGLWHLDELQITTNPTGRLGDYLLGFGQDLAGEMYVLTTDNTGPTGTTGKVYKLVRPSGA